MEKNTNKIKSILKNSKTIAIVGISKDKNKDSNICGAYLKYKGYNIIPVNPNAENILGIPAIKSLENINKKVDIVDVFRPSSEAEEITKAAIKIGAKVVWLQVGITNKNAEKLAEKNNILFVSNRCLAKEHKYLRYHY
ncbi:CoA-binding protein [archaeon]|nr:CoA-binding protein [archaeon]